MRKFIYPKAMVLEIMNMRMTINRLSYLEHKQNTENHIHSYYELHCITGGHIEFKIDFNEKLSLGTNDWLLLRKNVFHEETIQDDCSGFCIGIEIPDTSNSILGTLEGSRYYLSHDDQELYTILKSISNEMEQMAPGYDDYCRSILTQFLIRVFRQCLPGQFGAVICEQKYFNTRNVIDDFFNRYYRGIRDHFSVQDLAEKLYVTPRHVNRILNEQYGLSFGKMMLQTKLRHAEYLLRNTSKSLQEIGAECEMTEAYFFRSFKEQYKMTPRQYSKLYRKGD
ncbi:MAG: AraC family transcriptional regulator [Clostridia bacterium]|nr:AraC family transcriptional regulator [Clostridia bacterium]